MMNGSEPMVAKVMDLCGSLLRCTADFAIGGVTAVMVLMSRAMAVEDSVRNWKELKSLNGL